MHFHLTGSECTPPPPPSPHFYVPQECWHCPGGPVVKSSPCSAGHTGSIPGQQTKIPHATGRLSPCTTTEEGPAWRNDGPGVRQLRPHTVKEINHFFFFKECFLPNLTSRMRNVYVLITIFSFIKLQSPTEIPDKGLKTETEIDPRFQKFSKTSWTLWGSEGLIFWD